MLVVCCQPTHQGQLLSFLPPPMDLGLLLLTQLLLFLLEICESGCLVRGLQEWPGGADFVTVAAGILCIAGGDGLGRQERCRRPLALAAGRRSELAAADVVVPWACGPTLESHGKLIVEGHRIVQLVLAREDVAAGAERVGRVARSIGLAALAPVRLEVAGVLRFRVVVVVAIVATLDQRPGLVVAAARLAWVLRQVCGRGPVAQHLAAEPERQPTQETKVRGAGDDGRIGPAVVRGHCALPARPGESGISVAVAVAIAHCARAAGLRRGAVVCGGAPQAVEVVVAPAQQPVVLVLGPVVVEVEALLGAVPPAVVVRREAGRGAGIGALRQRRQAGRHIGMREAVEALLRRLIGMLDRVRDVLQRAIPPRVAAAVHCAGAAAARIERARQETSTSWQLVVPCCAVSFCA